MRDVGSEEHEIIRQEGREFVANPSLGAALRDEGDFALWMMVPDATEVFALNTLAGDEFGGGEG